MKGTDIRRSRDDTAPGKRPGTDTRTKPRSLWALGLVYNRPLKLVVLVARGAGFTAKWALMPKLQRVLL
jgi:hypothetical protein